MGYFAVLCMTCVSHPDTPGSLAAARVSPVEEECLGNQSVVVVTSSGQLLHATAPARRQGRPAPVNERSFRSGCSSEYHGIVPRGR